MATTTPEDRATFLYDDCCPLCRTYTATFTALGWADRAPFSQVSAETLDVIDMDKARHYIPLVNNQAGTAAYGLDAILGVVSQHAPLLGAIGKQPTIRWMLDRVYHFITYNRRHIIAAPPPVEGVDCAPDFEPVYVAAYLAFCAGVTALIGSAAPLSIAAVATTATALAVTRDASWNIKPLEAAGHVGSATLAAAGIASLTMIVSGHAQIAAGLALAVGARKVYLRRWMRTTKGGTTHAAVASHKPH